LLMNFVWIFTSASMPAYPVYIYIAVPRECCYSNKNWLPCMHLYYTRINGGLVLLCYELDGPKECDQAFHPDVAWWQHARRCMPWCSRPAAPSRGPLAGFGWWTTPTRLLAWCGSATSCTQTFHGTQLRYYCNHLSLLYTKNRSFFTAQFTSPAE
jgi:hypothetical protein